MIDQKLKTGTMMHGFKIERIENIDELRSQAVIFIHEKTKARVLHLFNEDPNNLFCICFRTPVFNNTGVPHILEHSVLSGSSKFPLKDPFKELLKGSLQTFLNALTYPDKTVYPVSSQVEADFFNLVDVYCDSVFHPLLSEMTFAQEGWHFDVEKVDGPVSIKGIVYNEMKGVFSDFRSHVARETISQLFPDTTYYYDSGGEPEHITDLTYEQFKQFHTLYYHPSNSFIVLYGNIASEKTLRFLDNKYLSSFEYCKVDSAIQFQPLWDKPHQVQFEAPAAKEDDGTASVIMCWLVGYSTDALTALLGRIFSHYLLSNESSPLRRALIDSGLGEDLDDMCGFDSDLAQGIFCAGLRKAKPENAEKIRDVILDTLKQEAAGRLDPELLEGSIRQVEFRLREITDSGHFPYNVMLAERTLRSWLYGGDPLAHLCFEKPLSVIKEKKKQGIDFFLKKLEELFVQNNHTLLSTVVASAALGEQLGKKSEEQALQLSSNFTEEDRRNYHTLTMLLREEQKKPVPQAIRDTLPKLDKLDLPKENERVPTEIASYSGVTVYTHPLFTAGIAYLDIGFDLTVLPPELIAYFPLYSEMMTRCGAAGLSFEAMAKRISLTTGGVTCSDMCVTRFGTSHDLVFKCMFHGKVLSHRFDEMLGIFSDLFLRPELENEKLVTDILYEMRNELNSAIVRSGNSYAASYAAARLSRSRFIEEKLDGISQLRFLDDLVSAKNIKAVVEAMKKIHAIVVNRNGCFCSLTADKPEEYRHSLTDFLQQLPANTVTPHEYQFLAQKPPKAIGIEINSSVNYVAQIRNIGALTPEATGCYFLLARNMSTGYLWDTIRVEGGAYGGSASVSSAHTVFHCTSYRDPNLLKTLDNFEAALHHVASHISDEEVDKNIIGTIGRLDQPHGPHSKGLGETIALLSGRTPQIRQQMREAILGSTPQTLAAYAQRLLDEPLTAVAVCGSSAAFDEAEAQGYMFDRERLLMNKMGT